MIGTIGHLGQVSPRRGRVCALLHLLGTILGAGTLGMLLGLAGAGLRLAAAELGIPWPGPLMVGAGLGLLALLCGLRELGMLRFPLLQRRRQVPRSWWYTMGTGRASFVWGLTLGLGVLTFIDYPVYYLVLLMALAGSPAYSALLLAFCGLGQGLVLVSRTVPRPCGASAAPREHLWSHRMHRLAGGVALAMSGYLLCVALMAWPALR